MIFGILLLGRGGKMNRNAIARDAWRPPCRPIAGILLIVGAGGGFKQVLIDTGIGNVITKAVIGSGLSVLLLAWVVAVLVRVATGSATVATVTAAGLLTPVAATLSPTEVALMVLAIGSGSLFLSHVNDAGFWLVKQYLGTTVAQNFKTWTVMECLISVVGSGRRADAQLDRLMSSAHAVTPPPPVLVVMGVAGTGKSTVAGLLAGHLGWELQEGDDLHPPANVAKMSEGIPADRRGPVALARPRRRLDRRADR